MLFPPLGIHCFPGGPTPTPALISIDPYVKLSTCSGKSSLTFSVNGPCYIKTLIVLVFSRAYYYLFM